MMQPCLVHLHAISLVGAHGRGVGQPAVQHPIVEHNRIARLPPTAIADTCHDDHRGRQARAHTPRCQHCNPGHSERRRQSSRHPAVLAPNHFNERLKTRTSVRDAAADRPGRRIIGQWLYSRKTRAAHHRGMAAPPTPPQRAGAAGRRPAHLVWSPGLPAPEPYAHDTKTVVGSSSAADSSATRVVSSNSVATA